MKKIMLTALAGATFMASSLAMPDMASAQSIMTTSLTNSGATVSGISAEQTVQKDFWSDLVDDLLGKDDPPPRHYRPGPPPPPPHHKPVPPHHNPPPPPHHKPVPPHHNPPPPHHGPAPHHGPHR